MTDQPTGRALAEAAARAMGWRKPSEQVRCDDCGWPLRKPEEPAGCERDRCSMVYNTELRADSPPEPTEREMMAWLQGRRCTVFITQFHMDGAWHVTADGWLPVQVNAGVTKTQRCPTLREALQRLVVAVAEREATNG